MRERDEYQNGVRAVNHRMLPPTVVAYMTRTVNGRTYSGTPGMVMDIPSFDAAMLMANGWIDVGPSGASTQRPTGTMGQYHSGAGFKFFDTTLGLTILSDGKDWRDPATGNIV